MRMENGGRVRNGKAPNIKDKHKKGVPDTSLRCNILKTLKFDIG